MLMYFTFHHAKMVKSLLKEERRKRAYDFFVSAFLGYQMTMIMINNFQTGEVELIILQVAFILAPLQMGCGLVYMTSTLENYAENLKELQDQNLAKYESMFSSIQESILVLKDERISYCNAQAARLL